MNPICIETLITYLDEMQVITFPPPPPTDERWRVVSYQHLYIDPGAAGDRFPVYLRFSARFPITAVGFLPAADESPIHPFDRKGPCGGCFSLESDIDPESRVTPLIRDDGPGTEPPAAYRFRLWFDEGEEGEGRGVSLDPQIYNEGVGRWPPWRRWRRRLRRR